MDIVSVIVSIISTIFAVGLLILLGGALIIGLLVLIYLFATGRRWD